MTSMEPTMRLRFVYRRDGLGQPKRILQQLWRHAVAWRDDAGFIHTEITAEEWRDIPVEGE